MPKTEECIGCDGRGEFQEQGRKITCPICKGVGRMPEGYAERAGRDIVNGPFLDNQERQDKGKEKLNKKWKM